MIQWESYKLKQYEIKIRPYVFVRTNGVGFKSFVHVLWLSLQARSSRCGVLCTYIYICIYTYVYMKRKNRNSRQTFLQIRTAPDLSCDNLCHYWA